MSSPKIREMHRAQVLKEELEEDFWKRQEEIDSAKQDFLEALAELRNIDPQGWEQWYDDENNLPDFRWKDIDKVRKNTRHIYAHIAEIDPRTQAERDLDEWQKEGELDKRLQYPM